MGMLFVIIANTALGAFLMEHVTKETEDDDILPEATLLAAALFSWLTAVVCLGLFDEAVMSILQCYGADSDLHDGVPKFGPPSYQEKLKLAEKEVDFEGGEED